VGTNLSPVKRSRNSPSFSAVLDPAEWEILAEDARPREVQDPEGRDVTIHDTVVKARRRVVL